MTRQEFHALPDDGVDRELISGVVREYSEEEVMSRRNRRHCLTTAKATYFLEAWCTTQPEPRGEVLTGDIGVMLTVNGVDADVGIDVAYLSPQHSLATPDDAVFIDGPPLLAVEVMSPSDTVRDIEDKIEVYLDAGVEAVWYLNPFRRTVTIYRQDRTEQLLSATQRLENEPYLPGFAVDVAAFFDK